MPTVRKLSEQELHAEQEMRATTAPRIKDALREQLSKAVYTALGAEPTPQRRRALITVLEELVHDQRSLHSDGATIIDGYPRPRSRRIGRAPGDFVRIERTAMHGRTEPRLKLYVGRALWYAIGSPPRLQVQRRDGRIVLEAAQGMDGYAVNVGQSMPRFWCDGARELFKNIPSGRFNVDIHGRTIVVGEPRPA